MLLHLMPTENPPPISASLSFLPGTSSSTCAARQRLAPSIPKLEVPRGPLQWQLQLWQGTLTGVGEDRERASRRPSALLAFKIQLQLLGHCDLYYDIPSTTPDNLWTSLIISVFLHNLHKALDIRGGDNFVYWSLPEEKENREDLSNEYSVTESCGHNIVQNSWLPKTSLSL